MYCTDCLAFAMRSFIAASYVSQSSATGLAAGRDDLTSESG